MKEKLVVALDRSSRDEILRLVDALAGRVGVMKIGLQAYVANGPSLVRELVDRGEKVFLDLKFHDIPNTAKNAVAEAGQLGASIVNVHATGGAAMLSACRSELPRGQAILLGVTILTSLGPGRGRSRERSRGQRPAARKALSGVRIGRCRRVASRNRPCPRSMRTRLRHPHARHSQRGRRSRRPEEDDDPRRGDSRGRRLHRRRSPDHGRFQPW